MSPRFQRFVACLSALLFANSAFSETVQSRAENTLPEGEEAHVRYQKGVRAYALGRYADAVEFFRDADQREPSAALSFDMARAYEKLGDDAGALRSYRDYLRRAKNPEDERAVRLLVSTLSARLAARGVQQLTVLSAPPGATVFLDSQAVGVTPWTSEMSPGAHTVLLRLEGQADAERRVDLPANEAIDVQIALKPAPAALPAATEVVPSLKPRAQASHPRPPPPQSARPLRTLGIIALTAGGAALGSAVVFELLRRDSEQKAKDEHEQVRLAEDIQTMESRRTAARVLGGLGAGLAAAGGVFLLVSPAAPATQDRTPQMKLNLTTSGVTGTVSGRF